MRLRVNIRVGNNGKVTSASLRPGRLAGTAMGRCILGKVRAWKLPSHTSPYAYSFTMRFNPN